MGTEWVQEWEKIKQKKKKGNILTIMGGLIFLGVFFLVVFAVGRAVRPVYPRTEVTAISCTEEDGTGYYDVTYQYWADCQTYTYNVRTTSPVTEGTTFICRYKPSNPTLLYGKRDFSFFIYLVPSFLCFFGAFLLFRRLKQLT